MGKIFFFSRFYIISVAKCLEYWIQHNFKEFDNEMVGLLIKFLSLTDSPILLNVKRIVEKQLFSQPQLCDLKDTPLSIYPENWKEGDKFNFIEWSPIEIAVCIL